MCAEGLIPEQHQQPVPEQGSGDSVGREDRHPGRNAWTLTINNDPSFKNLEERV